MEAIKFKVQTTFRINSRELYVIGGDVIRGAIHDQICLIRGDEKKKIQVHSQEFIKNGDSEIIGLLFLYKSIEDLRFFETIKIGDILDFFNCGIVNN